LLRLEGDRSDIETSTRPKQSTDGWGFGVGAEKSNEVSKVQFLVDRTFSPSVGGFRTEVDNAQVEYTRDLTERWSIGSAARYFRTRAQGRESEDDRDFMRAELGVNWRMTPTISLGAAYFYLRQEYKVDNDSGNDNVFLVRITYEGLPPQR